MRLLSPDAGTTAIAFLWLLLCGCATALVFFLPAADFFDVDADDTMTLDVEYFGNLALQAFFTSDARNDSCSLLAIS